MRTQADEMPDEAAAHCEECNWLARLGALHPDGRCFACGRTTAEVVRQEAEGQSRENRTED